MQKRRRLSAEWEEQDAILLAWPHAQTDWCDKLDEVSQVYIELVRAITPFEKVVIVSPEPEDVTSRLSDAQIELSRVDLYKIMTNDTWCRDFGPIIVQEEQKQIVLDFGFNGWGLKFAANFDNQVTRQLCEQGALINNIMTPGLVLEGGSLESDGQGLLLTTSRCLLEANRNPHLSRSELENHLSDLLGADKILWLDHGYLAGDDTDSHIDTLARLAPGNTIVYVQCDDPHDEHFTELNAMEEQLKGFTNLAGEAFRLLPLPWPKPICDADGCRLPATYANFLVINRAVLAPVYNDPADTLALQTLASAFPEREIIPINCRTLIEQHGSLHCVTMQLPKGVIQ